MGIIYSTIFYYYTLIFPPKPTFTEKECPDLEGRVFIVTGGYGGVGYELSKILYSKNGTVYMAGRTKSKGDKAVQDIKSEHPASKGKLEFLYVDLADLTTVRPAAKEFLTKESRLDVLWNNAGVMFSHSRSAQGYELDMATNCLGPYLFTKELTPLLVETARQSPTASVRVCWVASIYAHFATPRGGINLDNLTDPNYHKQNIHTKYAQSKIGNAFLAHEYAKKYESDGIISVVANPGNLNSDLRRHLPSIVSFAAHPWCYHSIYGAYTELFAGLSPEVTPDKNGSYINPWGRLNTRVERVRPDIMKAMETIEAGGSGVAKKFYDWCDAETSKY